MSRGNTTPQKCLVQSDRILNQRPDPRVQRHGVISKRVFVKRASAGYASSSACAHNKNSKRDSFVSHTVCIPMSYIGVPIKATNGKEFQWLLHQLFRRTGMKHVHLFLCGHHQHPHVDRSKYRGLNTHLHAFGEHPELQRAGVWWGAEQQRVLYIHDRLRFMQPLSPA